jgi:Domain of unknown function (DUF1990)
VRNLSSHLPRWVTISFQWSLGMVLVSWRYLWQVTPLHRTVQVGNVDDLPPPLPEHCIDERSQPLERGAGPLFHRVFSVRIDGATMTAQELISALAADLNQAVPSEVTSVDKDSDGLAVCDEFVVRMPGPWDGPVRVVERTDTSFRLATLLNHMEAGQIEFRAWPRGTSLQFEIEAWARPGSPIVNLLYTHLRLAKEIQLNMWVRFCQEASEVAGGRVEGGVTINTRVVEESQWRQPAASPARVGVIR